MTCPHCTHLTQCSQLCPRFEAWEYASPLLSHAEIAAELGITAQRVGQLERKALRKLRTILRAEDFI